MPSTIEAHITKVEREVGSEWGSIFTDHGEVKKLTTKREALLREAAEFKKSGTLVEISYNERTRTVDGRTYRNYYYEGGGSLYEQRNGGGDGIDVVQPRSSGAVEDPTRAWRICLQSGGKLAVQTLPLMPDQQRDFETQKTIARAWAEFFFFTPAPAGQTVDPTLGYAEPTRGYGAYSEPDGIEHPPPMQDDDIPFG